MATQGTVTKIYDLKTLGFSDIDKQLSKIEKDFIAIKKAKQAAEGKLSIATGTEEVKELSAELVKLKIQEQELRVERQKMLNEQKAANISRQEDIRLQKEKQKGNLSEAGSIVELRNRIRELNAEVVRRNQKGGGALGPINFEGQTLGIDQAIIKLKELVAQEQTFRRQFAKDATLVGEYTTGIVQAFKQMGLDDLVGGQVTKAQDQLKRLNGDFDRLQKELQETKAAGSSTDTIEKQMIENRNEVIKLDTELARLKTDLRGTGDVGNQITSSISNGFKSLKGQVGSFALQFIGIQAALSKAQQAFTDAKTVSDQTTDLEIQLGQTNEEAENLNNTFKKFNTRTTLAGLQQIADVALKAGASKDEIAELTRAIDIMKVAFGKDFGSVEEGTETFSKLINIFFDDGQITGDRMLRIGNAVRTLANETTASVPYLTDFSGRMAGLRQIANVTLPDILGLGAGFDQFKQSAEVSSTVLVKLIPKLAQDTAKFAQVIGVTQDEFSKLINNNPAEALIKVSEALVNSGEGVEEVSKALADSELGSGRITAIIGTLGGNAEVFRKRIASAGKAIEDTGAITEAFEKKNNNLAASMDKLNKRFSDAAASKGFQVTLAAIVGFITLLITNLPILLTLVGLLTVAWVAQNSALILLRGQVILYNLAIGANYVLMGALSIAQIAYNGLMLVFNGILKGVTAAMRLFGLTTTAATGPLGIFLAIAGLLGTAFVAFGRGIEVAKGELSEMIRLQRINIEVNREASKSIADQVSKIDGWKAVVESSVTSADTKRKAVEELIKIDKEFSNVLKDNVIDLNLLNEAYQKVIGSIQAKARAEAAASLTAKRQQNIQDIVALRQDLEIQTAQNQGKQSVFNVKLTDDQSAILQASNLVETGAIVSIGDNSAQIFADRFDQIKKFLDQKELEAINTYKDYLTVQVQTQEDLNKIEQQVMTEQEKTAQDVANSFEVDIAFLKSQIEKLNEQINAFQGSRNALAKLITDRDKLQVQLDKLLGKQTGSGKGSRLSGAQKDDFKDIDADRDEQLARLNKAFVEQENFVRKKQSVLRLQEDGTLKIVQEATRIRIDNEEKFLLESLRINKEAIDAKLKLLDGSNAEERKQIADLNLDKVKLEQDTNNKIYELRAQAFKDQFDITKKNAQEDADKIIKSPDINVSATDKAQAQLDADKKTLDAQILFNQQMDALEKDRNNISKKNAEDRARDLRQVNTSVTEDEAKLILAQIDDVKAAGEKLQAEFELAIDRAVAIVQADKNLSQSQKNAKIRLLESERQFGVLVRQAAQYKQLEEVFKKAYDAGLITLAQYEEIVKKLQELQQQIANSPQMNEVKLFSNVRIEFGESVQSYITRAFEKLGNDLEGKDIGKKLFGKVLNDEEAKALGDAFASAVTQSFALAQDVMNSYFDAEEARIQRELDLQLERIEMDHKQQEARSQSIAETESLEKQYLANKKKAEKEAFEKTKELKKKEAKIALATELANIWASVWSVGVPWVAIALGAVMSALAVGRYALRVGEINAQTFAEGGKPGETKQRSKPTFKQRVIGTVRKAIGFGGQRKEVPARGGEFGGRPHSKGGTNFQFKGKTYNAEAKEVAVVRTKDAPRGKQFNVTGDQMQLASAANVIGGGINFKPGAKIVKMFETGGSMGQSLQPPVYNPSTNNSTVINNAAAMSNEKLDDLIDAVNENSKAMDRRIDRLEVHQVTRTVTDAQRKEVKQSNVGTL